MRVRVLIGGNDDYHDIVGAGTILRDALLKDGITATMHLGWGEMQRGGDETSALVVCTNGMRMTKEDQAAIADRVERGLGIVAVHTASVTAETPEWHAVWLGLIGSRFVSHPPHGRFRVSIDRDHAVTHGVGGFEIEDELYVTEPAGEPVTVLASATHAGNSHPMVSVRERGKGRVCYIALGHDPRALHNHSFQRLFSQAVRWAAGGEAG
jgi:hypothetical protein